MSVLQRMLARDLWHHRGQVIAASLVVAAGIAALVATRGTYHSLRVAQQDYYANYRLADVFAHLKRAPESLAFAIERIPGVTQVQTRVVMDVTLDVPGLAEPATGRLISIPRTRTAILNDVHLLRGRYVDRERDDEVLASEAFARANRLDVGARIGAVLNGRLKNLVVVGIALSPEYVYEVGSGMLFPDNRRFGVLWMSRDALAPALQLAGAFNDVALALSTDAEPAEVVTRLDRLLEDYGGLSAHTRAEQASYRFLDDELGEIRIMTTFIPSLFLGVAAFLLYVVLSRLVNIQRAEIGLLKAFGRSDGRVALHYLLFALVTAGIGLGLGFPFGSVLGGMFVGVYEDFFHFPDLSFTVSPELLLIAVTVSLSAAGVGALGAVRRAAMLPPAEAMRPEAPTRFRAGLVERSGIAGWLSPSTRMMVRNLARKPWKATLSVLGMSFAIGLMVVGRFIIDAANHLMTVQFGALQHDDVTLVFAEPRQARVAFEVERLPGVLQAEPFRIVPVWLRHQHRSKRVELTGLSNARQLRVLADAKLRVVDVPPEGLMLGAKLAEILAVEPGSTLSVELLEGSRARWNVRVAAVVDEMLGLGAYMDARSLSRLLRESGNVSGEYLKLDSRRASDIYAQLKHMPAVSSVAVRGAIRESVRDTLDRAFGFFSMILLAFASVIVAGVVYNSVRISLSERGNELASLRVLGFTEREVAVILLGEHGVLTLTAIPLGLLVGYGLCALLVPVFDRETFRLPLILGRWAFIYPAVVTLIAASVSGLLVARRLQRLDLIGVLKTRE